MLFAPVNGSLRQANQSKEMAERADYTDKYIADILSKDAKDRSLKYSAVGLQAFLPQRQSSSGLKPNTRFLRNILLETDNHNAALLAKEREEARARQKSLKRQLKEPESDKSYRRHIPTYESRRKRQRLEYEEGAGERKSKDHEDTEREARRRRKHENGNKTHQKTDESEFFRWEESDSAQTSRKCKNKARRRHSPNRANPPAPGTSSSRREVSQTRRLKHHDRHQNHTGSRASRSPSASSLSESSHSDHRRHRHKRRYRSDRSSKRTFSHKNQDTKLRKAATVEKADGKVPSMRNQHSDRKTAATDSDSPDGDLGPEHPGQRLAVKVRGRGATHGTGSNIDSHFDSSYDPQQDAMPNSEREDDWDNALQALRDRQSWKQQGAERLRSAGLAEVDIKRWEKGGEKDETDVRWRSRSEGREWDRGKVVQADGQIDHQPEWGRLKDT